MKAVQIRGVRAIFHRPHPGNEMTPALTRAVRKYLMELGIAPERVEAYLRLLNYRLDERHVQGLAAFLDEAWRVGVLPERASVEFWR